MNGLELSKKIAGYLDNKKAKDVKILKIDDLTVVTDYIVIATGTTPRRCNVENEDWSAFTPSREVTHWMQGE